MEPNIQTTLTILHKYLTRITAITLNEIETAFQSLIDCAKYDPIVANSILVRISCAIIISNYYHFFYSIDCTENTAAQIQLVNLYLSKTSSHLYIPNKAINEPQCTPVLHAILMHILCKTNFFIGIQKLRLHKENIQLFENSSALLEQIYFKNAIESTRKEIETMKQIKDIKCIKQQVMPCISKWEEMEVQKALLNGKAQPKFRIEEEIIMNSEEATKLYESLSKEYSSKVQEIMNETPEIIQFWTLMPEIVSNNLEKDKIDSYYTLVSHVEEDADAILMSPNEK